MIITHDTTVPDDRILRSELLLAVSILRSNLALHPWLEYHTFPVRAMQSMYSAVSSELTLFLDPGVELSRDRGSDITDAYRK